MVANRPTAAELIEAAAEFLAGEAMDAIAADNVKFKLRIALNVLKLVERELRQGPEHEVRDRDRLQLLLGSHEASVDRLNADLCRRIREGQFDHRLSDLLPCLQQSTLEKLAIDNPRYSTYLALQSGD